MLINEVWGPHMGLLAKIFSLNIDIHVWTKRRKFKDNVSMSELNKKNHQQDVCICLRFFHRNLSLRRNMYHSQDNWKEHWENFTTLTFTYPTHLVFLDYFAGLISFSLEVFLLFATPPLWKHAVWINYITLYKLKHQRYACPSIL